MDSPNKDLETYWYQTTAQLAVQFKKDYQASALCFSQDKKIELYEHLLHCFELAEANLTDETGEVWKKYLDLEDTFHKKQGNRLKEYITKNMSIYYGDETAFVKKGIFTTEEWQKLPLEKQEIPTKHFHFFLDLCKGMLRNQCHNLWLEEPPEDEKNGKSDSQHPLASVGLKAASKAEESRRRAVDRATRLSQEQSVLLLHYLKEIHVFLRDEKLNNKDAGIAFSILTGYSPETIRQDLGRLEHLQTKENLEMLINYVSRLHLAVDKALKEVPKTKKNHE